MAKQQRNKKDISGSETVFEKLRESTPWLFGDKLRKPKIKFPKTKKLGIKLPAPSRSFWLIAVYVILFVLQMGIVYFIYREPPSIGADEQGQPLFIYPDLNESFIVEGIVASIFLFLASSGFLLLYQASKYVYNRKIALRILVIGVILIVISFVVLQFMLAIKAGTLQAGGQQ